MDRWNFLFQQQQLLRISRLGNNLVRGGGSRMDTPFPHFPSVCALVRACVNRCNPSPWDAQPSSCARGGERAAARFAGQLVAPTVDTWPERRGETILWHVCRTHEPGVCVCVCVLGRFILVYRSGRNAGGLGGGAHRELDGGAAGGMEMKEKGRGRLRGGERERRWTVATVG